MNRRYFVTGALALIAVVPRPVTAAVQPFDAQAFAAAQDAGAGIVVHVHAPW
jgi:hypothetical protein